MAITNVQSNIISEMQQIASDLLSVKSRLTMLAEMYGNENIANLTDGDLAAVPSFAHIVAAELQAAGAAMVAVNTSIGTGAASNGAKLMKIVVGMPK